ncbi:MAG: H/ACA ribonucleoprotein complex subunit 3 [Amphiamblys sp. WSBS2006]|nr:MAG: H/ACA ribonucleoprotein complex subunit 3 [Amphiamblys sp. WSBS2006]
MGLKMKFVLDKNKRRVYTLKETVGEEETKTAHPARFSPQDRYSRERVTIKKRFEIFPFE